MTNEDIIFYCHPLADKGMALDLTVFANLGSFLDFNECTYLALVTNLAPIQVYEVIDYDPFTKFYVRCNFFHN